eukprot:CAMPEP_0201872820 /NCGR_PEP_ID=MMETSP0902-20130614/5448_1 /ASSEMBLY_ACC=CAM_ASM_000551 /TAXON_ID=420261 /ORGANISM="Thalassiosira antarctica, Strain CCMP982" /LENGTH=760 /DNA_ID=CAMNT_0048399217 /DNA_START=68 /DNA_END=2350 /DNA_ORIENTATION=-
MASTSQQEKANPPLSKRQRRAQGSNPSTTWQQQPRIKSAGARARAYISYAGLADEVDKGAATSAGETKSSNTKKSNLSKRSIDLLDPQLDLHSPEVKFGRLLGGTDQRSRHNAVKMLREYLRARSDISSGAGLSELDLLKLWKGLWYTLYMADKMPVQDKLSKILAELMWCLAGTEEEDEYAGQVYSQMTEDEMMEEGVDGTLSEDEDGDTMEIIEMEDSDDENGMNDEENSSDEDEMEGNEEEDEEQRIEALNRPHCRGAHLVSLYISTFLRTVRREWGNVDKHRVDKFYTAVRFMVSEAYKYMSKRHWNLGIVRLFNDVLYEEGLSAETPGLTNGLRYHLIDICVDELAKVNKDAELQLTEATVLDCLEPFFALAQKAVDKNVQKRVMDNVLSKFLNEYSFVCPMATIDNEGEENEEEKSLIFNQVHVGTVSKFIFEIASDNNTDDRFRKSLYEMHKKFVRQIRDAGRDVNLDHYLEGEEEDAELDDDSSANKLVGEDEKCEEVQDGGEEETLKEQEIDATVEEKEDVIIHEKDDAEMGETASATPTTSKNEGADDITSAVTKYESTPEKKKKKRKKKSKASKESAHDVDAAAPETPKEAAAEGNSIATPPKTKSSSKKKRKKQDSEATENVTAADPVTTESKAPTTPKPRKKKQKSPTSVDPRSMHSPDQVISPTSPEMDMTASASKRVSFGAMNHCKSHKASMKAMKTLVKDRWDTTSRTPDKGILRPKEIMSSEKNTRPPLGRSSSRKKKGRKQA